MMQEPVQDAGGGGVLGQKPAPLLEGPMGGYGQGAAFVGGGNKPEQQLGAGVIERGEPDLVDLSRCRHKSTYPDLATMPILRRRERGNFCAGGDLGVCAADLVGILEAFEKGE